ncbi:MAG: polymer-forming cytoskeletal protein, partial [Anaerolineae bacterium]
MTINRQRFIWLVLLLTAGLLLPITPVMAGNSSPPGGEGIIVWNEDYTLEEGERLDGNLVIFNGDATLETDSRVEGSVIIWNGSVEVEGTIDGDVVVSRGDIYLGDDARVKGNVVCSWDCDLEQEEGARVEGMFTKGNLIEGIRIEPWQDIPI